MSAPVQEEPEPRTQVQQEPRTQVQQEPCIPFQQEPCTIEIMAGLGNQLFQIFHLLAYSAKCRKPFYFVNTPIKYGWRSNLYWDTPLLSALKAYVRPAPDANMYKLVHREYQFHYLPIPYNNYTFFFGYYQSYKYFHQVQEMIYNLIGLKETQQSMKDKQSAVYDWDNTISMHFRLGDYKAVQETHPLLKADYYQAALENLIQRTAKDDWVVLYFCEDEDIDTVEQGTLKHLRQVPALSNLKYLKINSQLKDWEQMLVMSLCRHHIIANSTFSWWGAYFSLHFVTSDPAKHSKKAVYYPKVWFGPSKSAYRINDLFPPNWIQL